VARIADFLGGIKLLSGEMSRNKCRCRPQWKRRRCSQSIDRLQIENNVVSVYARGIKIKYTTHSVPPFYLSLSFSRTNSSRLNPEFLRQNQPVSKSDTRFPQRDLGCVREPCEIKGFSRKSCRIASFNLFAFFLGKLDHAKFDTRFYKFDFNLSDRFSRIRLWDRIVFL